jgi:hypothetical protein
MVNNGFRAAAEGMFRSKWNERARCCVMRDDHHPLDAKIALDRHNLRPESDSERLE